MGPESSEMIQKSENIIINNSLIVDESYTGKSSNGDDSIFSQDENNLNHSQCSSSSSSEDLSNASSEDQLLDTCLGDVKYYVTAGKSPLSVVIKRCNSAKALNEDSCSNDLGSVLERPASSKLEDAPEYNTEQFNCDIFGGVPERPASSKLDDAPEYNTDQFDCDTLGGVPERPASSKLENAPEYNTDQFDPRSGYEVDKDFNTTVSGSPNRKDCLHPSMSRKPCTVSEYVETIKSLVEMGLSVSENDQGEGLQIVNDGNKSLVEILLGSQNTEEKASQASNALDEEKDYCVQKSSFLPFQQEDNEDVIWNSDRPSSGLPLQIENSSNLLSPNYQEEQLSIISSPLCNDSSPLNTDKSSYISMETSSHPQSTSTEPAHTSELAVETRNFIFDDSCTSPKSDCLQSETITLQFQAPNNPCHEATILKSESETFDSQLETTNSFDNTSLIDLGVDRIVYSPTLFSDDEDVENSSSCVPGIQKKSPSDVVCRRSRTEEARRLKQLQCSMIGPPPPPSVTNPQLSVEDILRSLHENKAAMVWSDSSTEEKEQQARLQQDAIDRIWPDAASSSHPGMYYNNGLRSEQFAMLSQKFVQRYVGAETACFCNVAGTTGSARKRNKKLGAGFSPGRRLSHLARRRKAFSRDNLLSSNAGSVPKSQPNALAERRQIVIGAKTKPGLNKPFITKPSLSFKSAAISGPRVLAHKRALFQSPEEGKKNASAKKSQSGSKRKNALRTGVESFKRALFGSASKDKKLPDEKISRNDGTHLVASSSKRKLLFDNLEGPSRMPVSQPASSFNTNLNGKLNHPGSSSTKNTDTKSALLNSGHKKKLLWAVAESLRKKGITMSHALFRPCASSLARVCRSLLPDLQRHNGSTSELMLEIADKYASDIVREKKAEVNTL